MDYTHLSKTLSLALRHEPEKFGIDLDKEGWTPLTGLIASLRKRNPAWVALSEDDLQEMMHQSAKQRFEIAEGRMRAYYGHSIEEKIDKEPAMPPSVLYHGTVETSLEAILKEGLKPMSRQYVHLSADIETAKIVGRRRKGKVVILHVAAAKAHTVGVAFYREEKGIWLSDAVPADFLLNPKS